MRLRLLLVAVCGGLGLLAATPAPADEIPEKYRDRVRKGLEYLVKHQHKDGHWDTNGGYPVAMTALAGMALLMEGSTLRGGKYEDNLRRATEWLLDKSQKDPQRDGLIGNPNNP